MDPFELAAEYRAKRRAYLDSKKETERLRGEQEQLQRQLFAALEAKNAQGIKAGGTNFSRVTQRYAQIQNRAKFVKWAAENAPSLIESKERKQLLDEKVRELVDNGQTLPEGVGLQIKDTISMTGGDSDAD
jgi:hypothetical protein